EQHQGYERRSPEEAKKAPCANSLLHGRIVADDDSMGAAGPAKVTRPTSTDFVCLNLETASFQLGVGRVFRMRCKELLYSRVRKHGGESRVRLDHIQFLEALLAGLAQVVYAALHIVCLSERLCQQEIEPPAVLHAAVLQDRSIA